MAVRVFLRAEVALKNNNKQNMIITITRMEYGRGR